jgi:ribose 5-phosphate isomerase A
MRIEDEALAMIPDGAIVGLGSGRAATAFVHALGRRVRQGFRVRGVPTSQNTAELARELGIPLLTLDEVDDIFITVDGADEVDPQLNLIKGLGGALVREKIVAAASRKLVILVGTEKLVPALGARGVLPVEVVPFGLALCRRELEKLGLPARVRQINSTLFVTDNSNYILDCQVGSIPQPAQLHQAISVIPGVVDTGLFIGMADTVLIQDGPRVEVRQRSGTR